MITIKSWGTVHYPPIVTTMLTSLISPACCLCQVVAAGEATVCGDHHARHHGLREKPSRCELTTRILWCCVDTVYKFYIYLFELLFE